MSFSAAYAAQAYGRAGGVNRPAAPAATPSTPQTPVATTGPIARIGQPAAPKVGSDPARLVAGQVESIDLSRDVAEIGGRAAANPAGVYSMYKRPADLNQAATGVALGRSLDVKG